MVSTEHTLPVGNMILGDCLEIMATFPANSIDMIFCDLPYATTDCKWDILIDLDKLWTEYRRIIKPRGIITLTSTQPFTSMLIYPNLDLYRHEWIWEKNKGQGHLQAKSRPLKAHEHITIFSKSGISGRAGTYTPQMREGEPYTRKCKATSKAYHTSYTDIQERNYTHRYPISVLKIPMLEPSQRIHTSQKPVALVEYFIKTYSQEGQLILDNCIGSGTTCVAADKNNRLWIGIEKDREILESAKARFERYLKGDPKAII